ncbi:vasorin b [Menidia menidia]
MKSHRLYTMENLLSPVMPLLILLLLPDGVLSDKCPKGCMCSAAYTVLCPQRRSSTIPREISPLTKSLYLFSNGIEGILPEHFEGLNGLEMLDLGQNELTHLPDRVFETLTSLRNLDLSSNKITHISEESLYGMPLLERLYLHNNGIKTIHPAAFNGLENLLELKLQGNMLTSLPTISIPSLLLLDLRHNPLSTLGPSDLQTPNLETLILADTKLTKLDKELVHNLKNLHELDLSSNLFDTFPPALKEIPNLSFLSLARNPMRSLKFENLQVPGNINELDISNISLQGLPEVFPQLFPQLRQLAVAENPFNCICSLAWFPGWVREDLILERQRETRCHFPPINAGKMLHKLEHRDFGCPTTTTVTTTTVKTTTTTLSVPVTNFSATTRVIQVPRASNSPVETEGHFPLPPVPASPSSSSMDPDEKLNFCPPKTCLNGGTCHLNHHGTVECTCPHGTSGMYCEVQNIYPPLLPKAELPKATVIADPPDIRCHQATATSILLDLKRYIKKRPHISGIRLTYSNLSGPDRRPIHLSLPASEKFQEYRLRGLNPNSSYTICASPLGAPNGLDSVCTEGQTAPGSTTGPPEKILSQKLNPILVPATAILPLLVLIAVIVALVCYFRRKKAKGHMDLGCEPSQLELDGVEDGMDNGALPCKQPELVIPEPAVQNGSLEYEVLLLQDHSASNNNVSPQKPSYF